MPKRSTPQAEAEMPTGSDTHAIRRKALHGTLWTFAGYGAQNVISLTRNVVVSHLLFPEALGLMAIVMVILQGIQMSSDIGIGPSIIQSERGHEPTFLHTAWSVQILRGGVIFAIALLLLYPISVFYDEVALRSLVPVAALAAVIAGFGSTNRFAANKDLLMGRLTALDITSQLGAFTVAVTWAYLQPTVWALVAGHIARFIIDAIGSHLLFSRPRMRLEWERSAAREILHFGKWIFISSILGFLAVTLDRIVLGRVLEWDELGRYSIAYFWASAFLMALNTIGSKVLFPVYAQLLNGSRDRLRSETFRLRAWLMACSLPPILFLVFFGDLAIDLLYDDRYADAGWMLRMLAAGAALSSVSNTVGAVLLAAGNSFRFMLMLASRTLALIAGMAVGGFFFDLPGLIAGVALADLINYPVLALCVRRYGVWLPKLDAFGFAVSFVFIFLAYWWR